MLSEKTMNSWNCINLHRHDKTTDTVHTNRSRATHAISAKRFPTKTVISGKSPNCYCRVFSGFIFADSLNTKKYQAFTCKFGRRRSKGQKSLGHVKYQQQARYNTATDDHMKLNFKLGGKIVVQSR